MLTIHMLLFLPVLSLSRPTCYFTKIEKHALYGQNTLILKEVSLDQCRTACIEHEDACASFDYNYDTDSCFMSDQTKDTEPGMFGHHTNMDYFQKVRKNGSFFTIG